MHTPYAHTMPRLHPVMCTHAPIMGIGAIAAPRMPLASSASQCLTGGPRRCQNSLHRFCETRWTAHARARKARLARTPRTQAGGHALGHNYAGTQEDAALESQLDAAKVERIRAIAHIGRPRREESTASKSPNIPVVHQFEHEYSETTRRVFERCACLFIAFCISV